LLADRMVVDNGPVLTAGSAFAHADLMLAMVARFWNLELAHRAARYLLLDARMSQSRYMVLEHLRATNPTLRVVEQHVSANLGRKLIVCASARRPTCWPPPKNPLKPSPPQLATPTRPLSDASTANTPVNHQAPPDHAQPSNIVDGPHYLCRVSGDPALPVAIACREVRGQA
jgi:hypothetical protein